MRLSSAEGAARAGTAVSGLGIPPAVGPWAGCPPAYLMGMAVFREVPISDVFPIFDVLCLAY
jgi:hypothetical protein